jgi:hypothetical protein
MNYNHRLEVLARTQLKFAVHQKLAEHCAAAAAHKLGQLLVLVLVCRYNHQSVL